MAKDEGSPPTDPRDELVDPLYYDLSKCKDVFDIARRFNLSAEVMSAIKYLVRCGKKSGVDAMDDLRKADSCVRREMQERSQESE